MLPLHFQVFFIPEANIGFTVGYFSWLGSVPTLYSSYRTLQIYSSTIHSTQR